MLSCTKDCFDVVQTLVDNGASLSLKNKDGWNSFHIACREGHCNIVSFLLDSDPLCWDTRSKNGRTPLHTAGEVCVCVHHSYCVRIYVCISFNHLHFSSPWTSGYYQDS